MKRVLIVDDDLDILESLEMVLSSRYDVRTALDGHRALALLDEDECDVAIVDLIMPGMDGEALIARMRARGMGIPVILASATPELAERARGIGVFAALGKPFTARALEQCLTAALASDGGDGGPGEGGASPAGATSTAAAGSPKETTGAREPDRALPPRWLATRAPTPGPARQFRFSRQISALSTPANPTQPR